MEQLVLFEFLCGTGAREGRRKWKKEQVGAVGGDVCDLSAAAWGSALLESKTTWLLQVNLH